MAGRGGPVGSAGATGAASWPLPGIGANYSTTYFGAGVTRVHTATSTNEEGQREFHLVITHTKLAAAELAPLTPPGYVTAGDVAPIGAPRTPRTGKFGSKSGGGGGARYEPYYYTPGPKGGKAGGGEDTGKPQQKGNDGDNGKGMGGHWNRW